MLPKTVTLRADAAALQILDQTKLPGRIEVLDITEPGALIEAIVSLRVRGAPAIGVAAALGLYVCMRPFSHMPPKQFCMKLLHLRDKIAKARPTAVNLSWALERCVRAALEPVPDSTEEALSRLRKEGEQIAAEDEEICAAIGRHGAALLQDGASVLTHCNAGSLATAGIGTALAPIYTAQREGKRLRVYCDETRPLLQGARLTMTELRESGVDCVLICDNMAASLMAAGRVDAVITGCDRVARNGDTANKIGTLGLAVLAKHYGIPFYICAPSSTIDRDCPDGAHIPIEERDGRELTELWYTEPVSPSGAKSYNPAFDISPAALITAYITEKGVFTQISEA